MRDFTDAVKFMVVRNNLEKNNGRICCELCGSELKSISEGHFDHIKPYAKGGKSIKTNCQILCSNCNLRKNDKELNDFVLDEKARKFLSGENVEENIKLKKEQKDLEIIDDSKEMTKDKFDTIIMNFISKKGNINRVDFRREYNKLPSFNYVLEYYGDFDSFKDSFGLEKKIDWNRENIKIALEKYIEINGDIFEKDLKTYNGLPSYPCILKYYPEYSGLNDLKKDMFNLKTRIQWDKEKTIEAGKKFVKEHGKITLKDLNLENNLPNSKVIYRYFKTMENFQKVVGSDISKKNELITIDEIDNAVNEVIKKNNGVFYNTNEFFELFPISKSVIQKNFGDLESFYNKYGITIINKKKAKFTKQEIDDIILSYIKNENEIPKAAKSLTKLGLPSRDAIMNYYEDWHEPFVLYSKLYEKIN